jgi:hypothetical protein
LIDVSRHTPRNSDLDPPGKVLLQFPNVPDAKVDWREVYVGFPDATISVAVPLRNVGNGPAVIDPGGVRVLGKGIDRKVLGREVHRERVPPGETTRILSISSTCSNGAALLDPRSMLVKMAPITFRAVRSSGALMVMAATAR